MGPCVTEPSIRGEYEKTSVLEYYQSLTTLYQNPHLPAIYKLLSRIENAIPRGAKVLDLCAGSGQLTLWFQKHRPDVKVVGCEPFLAAQYQEQTGHACYTLDFKAIAIKGLPAQFDVILCSYAFHLCDPSLRAMVCWQLAQMTEKLWLFAPNKNTGVVEPFMQNHHEKLESTHLFLYGTGQ